MAGNVGQCLDAVSPALEVGALSTQKRVEGEALGDQPVTRNLGLRQIQLLERIKPEGGVGGRSRLLDQPQGDLGLDAHGTGIR